MKKNLLLILVSVLFISFLACKKESKSDPGTQQTPLSFSALSVADSVIAVNAVTSITATATGDGLTYNWSTVGGYGTFNGSGAHVQWTVCHADKFVINCVVADQYGNSQTKSISIRSHD